MDLDTAYRWRKDCHQAYQEEARLDDLMNRVTETREPSRHPLLEKAAHLADFLSRLRSATHTAYRYDVRGETPRATHP